MATTNNPTREATPTNEMAQLIADSRAAAAVLSETIKQENEVFLSFCQGIISQTLNAAKELNALSVDTVKESASEKVAEAKKKASGAVAASSKATQKAVAARDTKESKDHSNLVAVSGGNIGVDSLPGGFRSAMLETMHNSVHAQQQMFVIAEATTTQTIAQILSIDTAALGATIVKILKE
ncbi:MAG: RebB family R body protein [Crocinitomicaceae bacterium]|nr:RebB family R body protein [Crocinitomicaceae bacterium]